MTRFISIIFSLFMVFQSFAQTSDMSQYSYVVVPQQYDFQGYADQYQLNSMTKFYLDKYGFNAFLTNERPNTDPCDGLFADVEKLNTIFGIKVQVVLRDCNRNEIYRGAEGRTKFKDFEKAYQDALRKAFSGMSLLNVDQKEIIVLTEKLAENEKPNIIVPAKSGTLDNLRLPSETYSNYTSEGHTFLLRKIGDGYSLYQESAVDREDLVLVGKVIVLDKLVKFMDLSGKVNDAAFDNAGTLTIGSGSSLTIYKKVKN